MQQQISQLLRTPPRHQPWRLGLLLASPVIRAWHAEMLNGVSEANAEIPVVLVHSPRMAGPQELDDRLSYFFRLLDRGLFARNSKQARSIPNPFLPVRRPASLASTEWIEIGPRGRRLEPALLQHVRAMGLDAIVELGGGDGGQELSSATRLGVWSHRHAGVPEPMAAAVIAGRVLRGDRAIESRLEALMPDGSRVLYSSWSAALHSPYGTLARCCWKAASFAKRVISAECDLRHRESVPLVVNRHSDGGKVVGEAQRGAVVSEFVAGRRQVSALSLAGAMFAAFYAKLADRIRGERWGVGVRRRRAHSLHHYSRLDPSGFKLILGRAGTFIADPFVFHHCGDNFIFCEEFDFSSGKGAISCIAIDERLNPGESQVVLERPYHLSYPFLINHGADLFMIPESSSNRTVEMYRCVRFPDCWELETVLLDGFPGVDTTLVRHDNKWWLFSTTALDNVQIHDELHIFYSRALDGPWQPHRRNPVISDIRRARSAGAFIQAEGCLIRPSQAFSQGYGSGTIFNRVITLTEDRYKEEMTGYLVDWHPAIRGSHTWNANEELEVTDGRIR